jgi:hypothetical protein
LLLSLVAPIYAGCDSVDVGFERENPEPPILWRIMVQDQDRTGGRFLFSDLFQLDDMPRACSDIDPCPGELLQHCDFETMLCDNPYATEPFVGIPRNDPLTNQVLGGIQVRLVFDQRLDSAMDAQLQADGDMTVDLADDTGILPSVKYLDNSGGHLINAFPYAEPFGPAIVIKPIASLHAGTTYKVMLNPSLIKDAEGQNPVNDIDGTAIKSEYTFTTEGLFLNEASPDIVSSTTAVIAPNDVLIFNANAPIDDDNVRTVETASAAITVIGPDGRRVPVIAFNELGDATDCEGTANERTLIVVRVLDFTATSTTPVDWEPGVHRIMFNDIGSSGPGSDAQLTDVEDAVFTVEGD